MTDRLLVLYDRDCGICVASSVRLRRWDARGRLEVMALQAAAADPRPMVREVAASRPLRDELHVVDPSTGSVSSGGRAVLQIAARLPGGRLPALLARIPPVAWVIGLGYGLVARHRRAIGRVLGLDAVCRVPAR